MNKKELIAVVAEKGNLSKKDAETIVGLVFDTIQSQLVAGEKVAIGGFGSFEVRDRAEKKGINPRTKEPIVVPASKAPAFKASKVLKDAVKG